MDIFLTKSKDLNILILSHIDPREALMVNKMAQKYDTDVLWRNRFGILYPDEFEAVRILKKRSWKDFLLLLEERYMHLSEWSYQRSLPLAARNGHDDFVDFFVLKGADRWREGMLAAALGGHLFLVEFFISKGADNWELAMESAAEGGHRDLVDFFISKGARYWPVGISGARRGGHQDLVDFFVTKADAEDTIEIW